MLKAPYKKDNKFISLSKDSIKLSITDVKINGINIASASGFSVVQALEWLGDLKNHLDDTKIKISERIIKEISKSLDYCKNVLES